MSILRTAREAPPVTELEQAIIANPDNLEARYQLSAVQLVASDYEAAMQQFLEIAQRDRGFRHDAGRVGLHAVFELLGGGDERVLRYRSVAAGGYALMSQRKNGPAQMHFRSGGCAASCPEQEAARLLLRRDSPFRGRTF